jgi:hypothetical protein
MCIYVAPGLIPTDIPNQYWMYYLATPQGHDTSNPTLARQGGIGRFKLILTPQQ